MNPSVIEALSVVLLVVVLGCAVVRPRGLPEAAAAVPAAALLVAVGAVPLEAVRAEAERLGPVVGFLAAVLVLARLCDEEGLFRYCGAWMAGTARGRPGRLLGQVFAVASVTTAVLSLDATVVLLTPVVLVTAARAGVRARPHLFACAHLANTASLLLPVSNLTNLLALSASGLGFGRFAALMAAPWLVAVAVEYLVFRRFFAADLAAAPGPVTAEPAPALPVFALVTVAATLAGFVVGSAVGVDPAWVAAAGALVLAVRALARGTAAAGAVKSRAGVLRMVLGAANPGFLAFVLALAVVVRAVVDNGLAGALDGLVPTGGGFAALLGIAVLAAVLANLINNLPAVLVLLPLVASGGAGPVLAVLLGVNIGPNLTYAGSLATLLWRRIAHVHGERAGLGEFTRLGLLTVPLSLLLSTGALWASLGVLGG
ncbi:SLC13 family permease [Kitasatospora sp. NPDC004240]